MRIYISHVVGRCAVCGSPVLDSGYSDDPELWEHDWAGSMPARPGVSR